MTISRSERFDIEVERQFRWYLVETGLDPLDAARLATRFADAVDECLEFLRLNPAVGRRRFGAYREFAGTRSWKISAPFNRFMVFYRVKGETLFVERLLEGHSRLAGEA
jgi:hypothetical protein